MSPLCRYRDALGTPGRGFHTHVLGVAVLDVLGTAGAAWWVSRRTGWSLGWTLLGAFGLGVLAHHEFCVNTRLNVALFGRV